MKKANILLPQPPQKIYIYTMVTEIVVPPTGPPNQKLRKNPPYKVWAFYQVELL